MPQGRRHFRNDSFGSFVATNDLDHRHQEGRIPVVHATVRSPAPIASAIAVIGIEEVLEATMASGLRATTGSSAAFFSVKSSTTDSTMIRAPSVRQGLHYLRRSRAASTCSGRSQPMLPRGGKPALDPLAGNIRTTSKDGDFMTAERVLTRDVRSHQPGPSRMIFTCGPSPSHGSRRASARARSAVAPTAQNEDRHRGDHRERGRLSPIEP